MVWRADAPHAAVEGTLTASTAREFGDYCELVVLFERVLKALDAEWDLRILREARGLRQRIEAVRRSFRLAPVGKPHTPDEPNDPFAAFDED